MIGMHADRTGWSDVTRSAEIRDRSLVSDVVIPSARYPYAESLDQFTSGKTTGDIGPYRQVQSSEIGRGRVAATRV